MNISVGEFIQKFASMCNIEQPEYEIINKAGEGFLVIYVGSVNSTYTSNLSKLKEKVSSEDFYDVFLKARRPEVWLHSSECHLLQNLLSESLTVGKAALSSEYHKKAIPFVAGKERQISNEANHIVFGRRGAGKSTLLLHACNRAVEEKIPFVWIAMQQFQGRDDLQVIPQFLYELIDSITTQYSLNDNDLKELKKIIFDLEEKGMNLKFQEIKVKLPIFARHILPFVRSSKRFYLFIDDLHLLNPELQPYFLSTLYSFSRGNDIYLKITAIENLTRLYNEVKQEGLQTPGDAQVVKLDYNLVNPHIAHDHIINILNSYVKYVGIPSTKSIVSGNPVLERLTWVSAGVPRDALYIFNNSISKAIANKRGKISVTDINMSAAESMIEKEHNISEDVQAKDSFIGKVIDDIKSFCIKEEKSNAFLIRINMDDSRYHQIHKISDLRFIHILHPGITPEKAGEKYEVFLLDYAFYTGFRKATSVKELSPKLKLPTAKELRKLPRYRYEDRLPEEPATLF